MKILCLKVHHIKLPLTSPWKTAYGVEDSTESILIKAYSRDAEAWVETCPLGMPLYSAECAISVFSMIVNHFGPLVMGKDLIESCSISQLFSKFRGNSFAKAGVEQCWWALDSVRKNVPLRHLFDGEDRRIEIGEGFGIQNSIDTLMEKIEDAIKRGISRIKLKICKGWDLEVIEAVSQTFPSLGLMVDCNGGYTLRDLPLFKKLDKLNLDMIEQPLYYRDLSDHATLQNELNTPVCLDESITSFRDTELAIKLKSCRVINIKVGRVGGISEVKSIHDLCTENGISCWIGGMMESGLGAACNIELATLNNITYPNEIAVSGRFHSLDVITPPILPMAGRFLNPSQETYIGKNVDESVIDKITIEKAELM